jgi:transposase
MLYRWRRGRISQSGKAAEVLDDRVRQLEAERKRVQQERDILKKALAIFGRNG